MKAPLLVLAVLLALLQDGSAPLAGEAVSGYDYLQPDMQAMQDDLFSNPGMLVVEQGEALFSTPGRTGNPVPTATVRMEHAWRRSASPAILFTARS
jgi:hypothetical protein